MVDVRINEAEMRKLLEGPAMVRYLADRARAAQRNVGAVPAGMELSHRAGYGRGRRGPFSQVVVRGRGAIAWEFGGRHTPPAGRVRSSIRGIR